MRSPRCSIATRAPFIGTRRDGWTRGVADDVMSETFLVAFERRTAFDGSANALPWLLGIATNLIKKHARLEARAWKGNFQC